MIVARKRQLIGNGLLYNMLTIQAYFNIQEVIPINPTVWQRISSQSVYPVVSYLTKTDICCMCYLPHVFTAHVVSVPEYQI